MTPWFAATREIRFRSRTFLAGLIALAVAVAVLSGQITLLKAHRIKEERFLAHKEQKLSEEMTAMEASYQKIMGRMGSSLTILPRSQSGEALYDMGFVSETMDEMIAGTVLKLSDATLPELQVVLEKKITWKKHAARSIIFKGIKGVFMIIPRDRDLPEPMTLQPNGIVLGYELWNSLNLTEGETIVVMGHSFNIQVCRDQMGNIEDISAIVPLRTAQSLLDMPGKISFIHTEKAFGEGLASDAVVKKIEHLIPGTRVVVNENKTLVRERALKQARKTGRETLALEQSHSRARYQAKKEMSLKLMSLVSIACLLFVTLVMAGEVRQRREEFAIYRAMGYSGRFLLGTLLVRILLQGVTGAMAGLMAGGLCAFYQTGSGAFDVSFFLKISAVILLATPAIMTATSLLGALHTFKTDPARVLRSAS